MPDPYTAVAVQSDVETADETDPDAARDTVMRNTERCMDLVDYVQMDRRYGSPRLVAFSEYALSSVPESRTIEGYRALATEIPGPVTDVVAEHAVEHDTYIVMNALEVDDAWPDRVFNCSFIVGPDGDVVLKYRKLNGAQVGHACYSNPGDIWSEYVEHYGGPEALFPVADTEIGRLACLSCTDIRYAEVARCLALRGAEVLIHPTAEPSREAAVSDSWDAARRTRAWENQCYLLSIDNGRVEGGPRPEFRQRGVTRIHGPDGGVLARTDAPGEAVTYARIDVDGLRRDRMEGLGYNVPMTSRFRTYAPIFEAQECWPADAFADRQPGSAAEADDAIEAAREAAIRKGVIRPPDGD